MLYYYTVLSIQSAFNTFTLQYSTVNLSVKSTLREDTILANFLSVLAVSLCPTAPNGSLKVFHATK